MHNLLLPKNNVIIIIFIFIFCSCSNKSLRIKVKDPLKDSLRKESLMRYSEKRLVPYLGQDSSYKDLGFCHIGQEKKAIKKLKRKILIEPDNLILWNSIGVCYYLIGESSIAHYFLRVALEKSNIRNKKLKSKILNNLGLVFIEWGNFDLAYQKFKGALEEDKSSIVAHYNIAQLYLKLGEPSNALIHLNKIPNSLEDDDISISKAFAYILKKEFKKTLSLLNELDTRNRKRKDVLFYKKYSEIKLGLVKDDEFHFDIQKSEIKISRIAN